MAALPVTPMPTPHLRRRAFLKARASSTPSSHRQDLHRSTAQLELVGAVAADLRRHNPLRFRDEPANWIRADH